MLTESPETLPLPALFITDTLEDCEDVYREEILAGLPGLQTLATVYLTDLMVDVDTSPSGSLSQMTVLAVRPVWRPETDEKQKQWLQRNGINQLCRLHCDIEKIGGDGIDRQFFRPSIPEQDLTVERLRPCPSDLDWLPGPYTDLPEKWDGQTVPCFVRLPAPGRQSYGEFLRDHVRLGWPAHEQFPEWYVDKILSKYDPAY